MHNSYIYDSFVAATIIVFLFLHALNIAALGFTDIYIHPAALFYFVTDETGYIHPLNSSY